MTRDELIAALEAATGPDRKLDFHIWQILNPEYTPVRGWTGADHYTFSIDAALTLVPDGAFWNLRTFWEPMEIDATRRYEAAVTTRHAADVGSRPDWSRAPTPAVALCKAALKARS